MCSLQLSRSARAPHTPNTFMICHDTAIHSHYPTEDDGNASCTQLRAAARPLITSGGCCAVVCRRLIARGIDAGGHPRRGVALGGAGRAADGRLQGETRRVYILAGCWSRRDDFISLLPIMSDLWGRLANRTTRESPRVRRLECVASRPSLSYR